MVAAVAIAVAMLLIGCSTSLNAEPRAVTMRRVGLVRHPDTEQGAMFEHVLRADSPDGHVDLFFSPTAPDYLDERGPCTSTFTSDGSGSTSCLSIDQLNGDAGISIGSLWSDESDITIYTLLGPKGTTRFIVRGPDETVTMNAIDRFAIHVALGNGPCRNTPDSIEAYADQELLLSTRPIDTCTE